MEFLIFGQPVPSIGTSNLGGCSVVLVVSTFRGDCRIYYPGDRSKNNGGGGVHCQSKMGVVAELYTANQHYFKGSNNWIVCALLDGQVALPAQQKIM